MPCAVAEWNNNDRVFITVLYLLHLVLAAVAPAAHQAPSTHNPHAQPATLVTLLRDSALAVQLAQTVQAVALNHHTQPATLAISALRDPCHRVVAAAPAVPHTKLVPVHQAHPTFQFLLIVPFQLNVPFTNILYQAGFNTQGLVTVRLLYCISLVSVVVPEFIVTSQSDPSPRYIEVIKFNML